MKLADCRGDWALVTGASSGIGREFATQLSAAGLNVVAVARRKALLDALALELSRRDGIQVVAMAIDLTGPRAIAEIAAQLAARAIRIRLLVNNAAFGRWGHFEGSSAETYEVMIRLNTWAVVGLCHEFLPHLSSFPTSAIVNVSSGACYQPVPYMAVYAASKAFVQSFSQALHGEWKDRGVLVQTLVAGPTATEFDGIAGAYESAVTHRGTAQDVVRVSLQNLARNTPVASNAKGTYKQRFFAGLFPPRMVIKTVGRMFKPPIGKQQR